MIHALACIPRGVADRRGIGTVGGMSMTADQVVGETTRFNAWAEVALRRCAELDSDKAGLISDDVTSKHIRKIVGRWSGDGMGRHLALPARRARLLSADTPPP